MFERLNSLWGADLPDCGPWRWSTVLYSIGDLSTLSSSRMYLQELEVKEHFSTSSTWSSSSLHLAVFGLILHLEVYWFAEISHLLLVCTSLRVGPYVLSAYLVWRGLTQRNGAIHSLIIFGILEFGRGCEASLKKKKEEKTARCCQLCFPKRFIRKYAVRICSAFLWFDQEYPGGMSEAI